MHVKVQIDCLSLLGHIHKGSAGGWRCSLCGKTDGIYQVNFKCTQLYKQGGDEGEERVTDTDVMGKYDVNMLLK